MKQAQMQQAQRPPQKPGQPDQIEDKINEAKAANSVVPPREHAVSLISGVLFS